VFGDAYLYAGLGTTLGVSANPRDTYDRRSANVLDESDLRSYRTLLAHSDDLSDSELKEVRLAQTE
jgi:hypothetical protein